MPKAVVTDGYSLDEHIPLYLRDAFYKSSYPEYTYNTTDGYGPYDFSTQGLVLYLPLWALKGDTFKSVDAYEHTATNVGALWSPLGRWFDQDDDTITVPAHAAMANIWAGGGTMSAWINPGSDGELSVARILDKRSGGAGWYTSVNSEVASKVKIRFAIDRATADGIWDTTATEVTIDTWSLVTITYDSDSVDNNALIYVNGASKGVTEITGPPVGAANDDTALDLLIGTEETVAAVFDGYIGDCWMYTRIQSAAEVLHNYKTTSWRYR